MRLLPFLATLLLFTSCASIVNKRHYNATIASNARNAQIRLYDSVYDLPATVRLKRSKEDLAVTVITDTLSKNFTVPSRADIDSYIGNITLFSFFSPIAIAVDRKNEKNRFYGRNIFLDMEDSLGIADPKRKLYRNRDMMMPKGRVNLVLSTPYVNNFYLKPQGYGEKWSTGFLGAGLGMEYYYRDDHSLRLSASGIIDFFLPVPVPLDSEGESEVMSSFGVSLTHNHRMGRFTFGYGPSWTVNTWVRTNILDWTTDEHYYIENITRSFGLSLTGHYRIWPSVHAGLLYNPALYNVTPVGKFQYSHTLSLDIQWRLRLWD